MKGFLVALVNGRTYLRGTSGDKATDGARRLGRVWGAGAALMVLSSAASPPLPGWALARGFPLAWLCLIAAGYAMIMPLAANRVPGLRPSRPMQDEAVKWTSAR